MTEIIAEIGVNHNGDVKIAIDMIIKAADAGVPTVKFQHFVADRLCTPRAGKAIYQIEATGMKQTQLEMLRSLELDDGSWRLLKEICDDSGVEMLVTPFDAESLEFLFGNDLIKRIKIGSGNITDLRLLEEARLTALPVILSTGGASLLDINDALAVLDPIKPGRHISNVTLLHCISEYPAPVDQMDLAAMAMLKTISNYHVIPNVGLSDHSQGITIALAAVAMGATIVEKHFTLDQTMDGPDHWMSIDEGELIALCEDAAKIKAAMGSGTRWISDAEHANTKMSRKVLVAKSTIRPGDVFSNSNVTAMRTGGDGISPMLIDELLGKSATRMVKRNEAIDFPDLTA